MGKKEKFTFQIVLLPVVLVVVSVSILTVFSIRDFNSKVEKDIAAATENYISQHKITIANRVGFIVNNIEYRKNHVKSTLENLIKTKVDEAVSIAEEIYRSNKGLIPDERIKEIIKTTLSSAHFGSEEGYFFTVDLNTGKIIVHKNPAFIGYSMENHKDARGLPVLKLQRELLAKSDSAFHNMYFTKPESSSEFPKRVYIRKFEPYNWMVGTGEYYDTIEKISQNDTIEALGTINDGSDDLYILQMNKEAKSAPEGEVLFCTECPEKIGKTISLSGDRSYMADALEKAKHSQGGFTEHIYKDPATGETTRKISYVYYQHDWDWLISSGFIFDELDQAVAAEKRQLAATTNINIKNSLVLAICLSLFSGLIAYLTAVRINSTINKYNAEIEEINKSLEQRIQTALEKNRRQEQIIHEQKKLADMGQMLNAIAHQWRQPLNVLGLYGQEMVDRINDKDLNDDFVSEFSKTHMDMVQYLSATIDDFRKFFKPDTEKEVYDLKIQMQSLISFIEVQFRNNSIDIAVTCECNGKNCAEGDGIDFTICEKHHPKIYGYPGEFRQVLVNILYNAKDALKEQMDKGALTSGRVGLHFAFDKSRVRIKISNNGTEIPEELKEKIFQPYFTTKMEGQGTGLGLYIAKVAVEEHMSGSLTLDTSDRQTSFIIDIPVYRD